MKAANKDNNINFFLFLVLTVLALFFTYFDAIVNKIDSTMFAFSYKYGFISRGFVGTVFRGINNLLPFDIMNYNGVFIFCLISTFIYIILIFLFYILVLKKSDIKVKKSLKYMMFFFLLFAIPIFVGEENFGRLDIYMIMCSITAVMLILCEKIEWIIIPILAIAVMVHQGYVFMFANVVLVLLMYKALMGEKKDTKKYLVLFVLTFIIISGLFLYMELFSHSTGKDVYEEVVNLAQSMSHDGYSIHEDVIDKEILGIDISANETAFHIKNIFEFGVFVVMMLPYIIIVAKFFGRLIKSADDRKQRWVYIIVLIGSGTILPDMLFKIDYGRWMFSIIFYYAITIMSLLALRDKNVEEQLVAGMSNIKKKGPISLLLLIYPIVFQPFLAIYISDITSKIADVIMKICHVW